jgi:hypothetical protein
LCEVGPVRLPQSAFNLRACSCSKSTCAAGEAYLKVTVCIGAGGGGKCACYISIACGCPVTGKTVCKTEDTSITVIIISATQTFGLNFFMLASISPLPLVIHSNEKMVCGFYHFVMISLRRRYTTKHCEVSRTLLFSA